MCLAAATRFTWMAALAGEMSGSSPEADVVTASGGICEILTWSNAAICFCRCLMAVTRSGLFGPRLEVLRQRVALGGHEVLAQQAGADHAPVGADQRAVGLVVERHLRDGHHH